MKRGSNFLMLALVLAALMFSSAQSGKAAVAQKMAVPAYFYPISYWPQLEDAAPIVGLAIMNPASGPGTTVDPTYVSVIQSAQASGVTIIGYVTSSYGTRPLATVKAEIGKYIQWYHVDGIFIDEASNDCAKRSYYKNLYNSIKARDAQLQVVINPGTNTQECFMAATDIVINFENTYAVYRTWSPSGWESKYPASRFWHLVYGANEAQMQRAIALSKQRNAGWVYVTNDVLVNPWDTLPADPYWTNELNRINK